MANHEDNRTGERRITLALYLMRGKASLDDILRLPIYSAAVANKSPKAARELVEKDIRILRDSGYSVEQALSPMNDYEYWVDQSSNIEVNSHGLDLSVLKGVLGHKGRTNTEQIMQSGMNKLLADAAQSQTSQAYRTNVPTGEFIGNIANALQRSQRLSFTYQSTSKQGVATYVVDPQKLHVYFDAFYFSGWEISVDGKPTGAPRIFKVDRIVSAPKTIGEQAVHDAVDIPDSEAFQLVRATLLVKEGTAVPLRNLVSLTLSGDPHIRREGFDRLDVNGVDKHDLFDYLLFYGTDVYLESPDWLREEFLTRLRHINEMLSTEVNND
ncbi:WYL domain-containing protein [Arcanobacterium ihumii]|uniref:WYL domain-containing protein n=1 Tax=Arcanobacterium ihumii TaxID=2138162 RepID=UPI000F53EA9B|nr:WYL domain-containing protein [Arcanobacterium ihumii]